MTEATPASPSLVLASTLLVMGKGGVGKTTMAASLAVLEAQLRGRAVLVEFGDGESGRRALGVGEDGRSEGLGVEHVVIHADEAIHRGSTPLFGSSTLAKLALDNFAMRPLLRAAPAIREIAMLESVRQIAAERPGVRVIVDMPATGHGVAWLRTARQGRAFLGSGPLFDLCDRVARELVAPGRASPIVVTLPERLVLEETLELCASIARDPGLPVAAIIVNRVPRAFGAEAMRETRALHVASPGGSASALLALLESRAAASLDAASVLEGLSGQPGSLGPAALWTVPLYPTDPTVATVARVLRQQGYP